MTLLFGQNNLAIFGYGSLLTDPGERLRRTSLLASRTQAHGRSSTPAGQGSEATGRLSSSTRRGKLLVLDVAQDRTGEVEEWLWEREGKPPRAQIKQMELNGFGCVFYGDLEPTLGTAQLTPESLAQFAIESVRANLERNGIRYLADKIDQGIVTPLTYPYRDAVLRLTGAIDLRQAEKILLVNDAGL